MDSATWINLYTRVFSIVCTSIKIIVTLLQIGIYEYLYKYVNIYYKFSQNRCDFPIFSETKEPYIPW